MRRNEPKTSGKWPEKLRSYRNINAHKQPEKAEQDRRTERLFVRSTKTAYINSAVNEEEEA